MILDGSSLSDSSADSDDSGTFHLKIVLVTPWNLVERTINSSQQQLLLRCLSWATTTIEVSRHIVFSMKIFEVASSLKNLASFSDLQNQSESLRLLPKLLSLASCWRFQAPLPPQCRSPRANEWHDRILGADHRIAVGGMCHCHLHNCCKWLCLKNRVSLKIPTSSGQESCLMFPMKVAFWRAYHLQTPIIPSIRRDHLSQQGTAPAHPPPI